jgi:hypothetical protein
MYSGHNTFVRPTNLNTSKLELIFADRKGGFPHSEITGSKGARASPVLIAACHVLHRLSMPRHPSEALIRLIVLSKTHDRTTLFEHALCQTMMSSEVRPGSAGWRRRDPSFTMSIADPEYGSCKLAILDREVWWSQTGSNRRPHACKARALPTELWPHFQDILGRSPVSEGAVI